MPLRNRLEEVIRRYDQAASLVEKYQKGEVSEEELGSNFQRLRDERRSIDEENRAFILAQRRAQWGEAAAAQYEQELAEMDEEETEDDDNDEYESDDSGDDMDDSEMDTEEEDEHEAKEDIVKDDEEEEVAEEEEDVPIAPDGANRAEGQEEEDASKREKKLWKEYGSFWRPA